MDSITKRPDQNPIQHATHDLQRANTGGIARDVATAEEIGTAIVQSKASLLSRLFPNPTQRAKAEAEVRMARTELDAMHRTLVIVKESRIQVLTELVNQALLQGKGSMREETYSFLVEKHNSLESAMLREWEKLAAENDRAYVAAQQVVHPATRGVALSRIDDRAVRFKEFSDRLVKEFEQIIDEQIRTSAAK